ncbi:hypothetical protein U0070_016661, partial [Myodes glareolus]
PRDEHRMGRAPYVELSTGVVRVAAGCTQGSSVGLVLGTSPCSVPSAGGGGTATPRKLRHFRAGASVFTVEEMMLHIQHLKGAHSKKRRKTTGWWQFFMIDKLNDLGKQLGVGSGNLCFADETAMLEKVKVGQGCATPWHSSVMIEIDSALSEGGHEEVYFHPVTNAATMELSPEDFVVFVNATGHDPIILNFD